MAPSSSSSSKGTKATSASSSNTQTKPQQHQREFNPRIWCYAALAIFSLACLLSVNNVDHEQSRIDRKIKNASFVFALLSFVVSCIVLILDVFNSHHPLESDNNGGDDDDDENSGILDLKNAKDYREGILLVCYCIWWIAGVALMTSTDGIAYLALNIYFSAWACFFLSFHTLNDWTSERDIISFRQLTHLSWTLTGWYMLLLCSFVVFCSVVHGFDMFRQINYSAAAYAATTAILSCILSIFFILSHYKLICCFCGWEPRVGGWLEIICAVTTVVWWLIELDLTTTYGSFAATIDGKTCLAKGERKFPGSNVYLASWLSFLSSCYIVMQWKAERALEFAQTQQDLISRAATTTLEEDNEEVDDIGKINRKHAVNDDGTADDVDDYEI